MKEKGANQSLPWHLIIPLLIVILVIGYSLHSHNPLCEIAIPGFGSIKFYECGKSSEPTQDRGSLAPIANQTPRDSQASNRTPTISTIETSPESQQAVGRPILIKIRANDSDNDKIYYKFMTKRQNEEFMSRTGWTTDSEWEWTPTEDQVGNNQIRVYVKDEKQHLNEDNDYIDKDFRITEKPENDKYYDITAKRNRSSILGSLEKEGDNHSFVNTAN